MKSPKVGERGGGGGAPRRQGGGGPGSPPPPALCPLAVLCRDLLDRAHGTDRSWAQGAIKGLQIELGFADAAAGEPVELAALDRQQVLVARWRQRLLLRRRTRLLLQQRDLE